MRFPLFLFLLFLCLYCHGQQVKIYSCGDDQLNNLLMKMDSSYPQRQMNSNRQLRNYLLQKKDGQSPVLQSVSPDSNFVIPVVVHIMYPKGTPYGIGTNISYAQVRSQIEALNAAYSKNYPSYNNQTHPGYAVDARIRFCLARNTADTSKWATGPGGTEFGVMRYGVPPDIYDHEISASSAKRLLSITHPSPQSFPFDKYLNIWLVSSIDGGNNVMGYAPRPILPSYMLDGVVMRADIFGDNTTGGNFNLGFGLTQGKILAHEVGHYFNLYHIFQGGCAGANPAGAATDACDLFGDMICDIEPSTTQNVYCTGTSPNTCTANYATGTTTDDMINDYMSYADDDCMNTFTLNQAQRMWATLNLQRPGLWQPENLIATGVLGDDGCIPPYLNAQIKTDNVVFCSGKTIQFSNPTAGNTATSYQWTFAGGNPSVSSANNVTVNYAQPGNYKVFLTVSNGSIIRTDSLLLTVSDCKPDSSTLSMAHWYFGNFGSIDFSSGVPIQTTTALTNHSIQGELAYPTQNGPYIKSTISLSDSLGNLLFYSNAVSVWNKNHEKITSAPIFGVSDINASSGYCYIPFPGKKGKYFAAGVYPNFDESPSGVRFVLVDVDSNRVSPYKEFKNIALPKRFSEFLTVVPHCNGMDYWIIVKGFQSDTKFYSFLVTDSGIDALQTPVISSGFSHPGYGGDGNQLKSNRAGDKLILCSPHGNLNIETGVIYDFDNGTGLISNERIIPNIPAYSNIQGGGAFSPNGKYFYLMRSSNFATNGLPYWLFQYRTDDMSYNVFPAPGFYFAASFQQGPDGNIYITTQDNKVARISNPDEWGAISFDGSFLNMMQLNPDIRTGVSIPSFIDARRPDPKHPDFNYKTVSCNTFQFNAKCFDNYTSTWNFGDGSGTETGGLINHNFKNPGEYTVSLTLTNGTIVYGSVSKKITVLPLSANFSGPGFVCANGNNPTEYFADILKDVDYKWSVTNGGNISGANNLQYVNVLWNQNSASGIISLDIKREGCLLNKTQSITISKGPQFNWSLPDSVCINDSSIILTAGPTGGSFSGPGVSNNIFSPAKAGLGYHLLKYTYSDEITCLGQVEKKIKVSLCNIPVTADIDCNSIFNSIVISPNPVTNLLHLQSPYSLKYVQIYNYAGQKIKAGELVNNNIDLPVLNSGVYTVLVFCEKNMSFRAFKFIKL